MATENGFRINNLTGVLALKKMHFDIARESGFTMFNVRIFTSPHFALFTGMG